MPYKNREDKLANHKKYNEEHREEINAAMRVKAKEYYYKNKAVINERRKLRIQQLRATEKKYLELIKTEPAPEVKTETEPVETENIVFEKPEYLGV